MRKNQYTSNLNNTITEEILKNAYLKHKFKNIQEVANYFSCSYPTIVKYMRKYNFKITTISKRKYECNYTFFSEINEKSAYWAGFIAADGGVYKKDLNIHLASKDENHLKKFKEDLNFSKPILYRNDKSSFEKYKEKFYSSCSIKLVSNTIINDLKKFNIVPNKSLTYKFPDLMINSLFLKDFIRGIWDGDGSIGFIKVQKKYIYPQVSIVGNKNLLESIVILLNDKLQINLPKIMKDKRSKIYQLNCRNKNYVLKILHYLYDDATIYLDRKYEKAKLIMENYS